MYNGMYACVPTYFHTDTDVCRQTAISSGTTEFNNQSFQDQHTLHM